MAATSLSDRELARMIMERRNKEKETRRNANEGDSSTPTTNQSRIVAQKRARGESSSDTEMLDRLPRTTSFSTEPFLLDSETELERMETLSLWDPCFNSGQFIDDFLSESTDMARFEALGCSKAMESMQTYGLQFAFLARASYKVFKKMEEEMSEQAMEYEEMKKKMTEIEKFIAEKESILETLEQVRLQLDQVTKDNEKLANNNKELGISLDAEKKAALARENDWKAKLEEANKKLVEVKELASVKYETGFNNAVGQMSVLLPQFDTSEMSVFKEVKDGKLVDMEF